MSKLSVSLLALGMVSASLAQTPKIERDLLQAVKAAPERSVEVVLFLSEQHAARAAHELAPIFAPRLTAAYDVLRRDALAIRKMPSLRPGDEASFANVASDRLRLESLRPIGGLIDRIRSEYADAITSRSSVTARWDIEALGSTVRALGGTVLASTTVVSTIVARVPGNSVGRLAADPRIATVSLAHDGEKELNNSAQALGAPTFWNANVTGGPQDVGTLDTGAFRNHAAFTGFRWEGATTDSDGHGTHVTGIMASKDATNRGMAWGADTISVAATSSESQSLTGMNFLMNTVIERAENVNHSFGYGAATSTDYRNTDQFFDGACDTFQIMVSKSTGNNGYSTTTNITHPAPAYNLLAVASVDDLNSPTRADDRISSFSSTGPTLAGRKKPDLATPGSNILSTDNAATGFVSLSGTSMAAPHAGGSVVLLMAAGAPSPMAAKAVLINTTDPIDSKNTSSTADDTSVTGSFWDRRYGWGYVNLTSAFLHAPDVFQASLAAPGAIRSFKLYKGQMFTSERATLTWNRHVAFNGSNYPTIIRQLSPLDLRAYNEGTNALLAASASTIDNVEQLAVPSDSATVLKVSAEGAFDPNVASETYALATQENFVPAVGPSMGAQFFKDPTQFYSAPFDIRVRLTNSGDLPGHGLTMEIAGYQVLNGANPRTVGSLLPGSFVDVVWTVRRQINIGNNPAYVRVLGNAYGENWAWQLFQPGPP